MSKQDRLGDRSRNALLWDLIGSFLKQCATLTITIILARLLSPEHFGVIGIALVFTTLSQVFIDVGFTDGLIQRRSVSNEIFSSIFYVNLAISILLATILFMLAPWVGNFYHNKEITQVIRYLTLVLPISAIGRVHATRLVKSLQFKSLTIRDILSSIAGGIIGIVAALKNQGVYSLVWQQLTVVSVSSILLWIGSRWMPSFTFSWREIRPILSFSSYVFFDQVFRQFFQKLDTLFIGKVFSPTTLGFYSRAEALNAQVTTYTSSSLQKVIFPVLSMVQDDDVSFREIYFKVFSLLAVVSSTLAGILFFLSDKIILDLLGKQWAPSLLIFQILVFKTLTAPFGGLMGKSLLSKGYSKAKFKMSIFQRIIMVLPMAFGLLYGIEVFALAIVGASLVSFLLNAYVLDRFLQLEFFKQLTSFLKPLIPLIIVGVARYSLFNWINPLVILLVYISLQWIFLSWIKDEGYLIVVREFVPRIKNLFLKIEV